MSASGHSSFDPPSEADPIFQTGTLRHREVRALAGAMQGFVHSLCSGGWKHKGISKILGQRKRGPGADDKPAHSGEKQGLGETRSWKRLLRRGQSESGRRDPQGTHGTHKGPEAGT